MPFIHGLRAEQERFEGAEEQLMTAQAENEAVTTAGNTAG